MTLEKLDQLLSEGRMQQIYDNTTGVASVLVTNISWGQLVVIMQLARDRLRAEWPVDFQI